MVENNGIDTLARTLWGEARINANDGLNLDAEL